MKILTPGLTYEDEGHRYFLDGAPILGNTSVLRLAGWVNDEWFTEHARKRGSAVHAATHYADEGDLDEESLTPEVRGYLEGWLRYRSDTRNEPVHIESAVASRLFRVATTVDRIELVGRSKKLAVLEIKTGSPGIAAQVQTAGQKFCARENNIDVVERWCIQLFPTGTYTLTRHTDPKDHERFIRSVVDVYDKQSLGLLKEKHA